MAREMRASCIFYAKSQHFKLTGKRRMKKKKLDVWKKFYFWHANALFRIVWNCTTIPLVEWLSYQEECLIISRVNGKKQQGRFVFVHPNKFSCQMPLLLNISHRRKEYFQSNNIPSTISRGVPTWILWIHEASEIRYSYIYFHFHLFSWGT